MDANTRQTSPSDSERLPFQQRPPAWRALVLALSASAIVVTIAASPPPLVLLTPDGVKSAAAGPARDKLVTAAQNFTGTVTTAYTPAPSDEPTPAETPIDLSGLLASQSESVQTLQQPSKAQQCTAGTIAPQVFKAKGKLTSEGYLVLEGQCFGNNGSIEVSGFPNGNPHMTIEAWTPTAITAQFPKISGVPDLTMHIQVKRTLESKAFDAKFAAAMGDPVQLPAFFAKNNECASSGFCVNQLYSTGMHFDKTNTNGADVWTMSMPKYFHLHSIELHHITGGHASMSMINSGSTTKTFEVSWAEHAHDMYQNVTTTHTTDNGTSADSIFEDIVTGGATAAANSGTTTTTTTTKEKVTVYIESYYFKMMVRGPLGMPPI